MYMVQNIIVTLRLTHIVIIIIIITFIRHKSLVIFLYSLTDYGYCVILNKHNNIIVVPEFSIEEYIATVFL